VLGTLIGAAGESSAQTPGPPSPVQPGPAPGPFDHNQGFMIGVGLGPAHATCDNCEGRTSTGLDFHIGGFVNPRLALMYDISLWIDSDADATLSLASHTFAAQYWAAPAVWVRSGLGFSYGNLETSSGTSDDSGTAFTAAVGVEVLQHGNFALDLSGRFSALDFDGGSFRLYMALLGVSWK